MNRATCRICGEITRYGLRYQGLISCNKAECREASRQIKNEAIRQAALRRYASGERRPTSRRWKNIPRVSPIEELIKPALLSSGWTDQYRLIPGVKGVHAPRTYHLDFALVDKKLCVEIDGSSHSKQRQFERDSRRDEYLAAIGWKTLRLTNQEVIDDPRGAVSKITAWADGEPVPLPDSPQLCIHCGRAMIRSKRKTCSRECHTAIHAEKIRGRSFSREKRETAQQDSRGVGIHDRKWIPCRICGGPTKLNGTPAHPRYNTTACNKPECREASRLITIQNRSKALKGNQKLIASTRAAWNKRLNDLGEELES